MSLNFTLCDVFDRKPISIDDVLVGISKGEKQKSIEWTGSLRDVEQKNVIASLAAVLGI